MADYGRWTKEALVRRVQELEQALAQSPAPSQQETATHPSVKRPKKPIDPSKYATRYIALKLAYLGKRYGGFEYQPSGGLPTVEEELWKALVKACLVFPADGAAEHEVDFTVCDYSKCGRTDRGVSAFGQVVALRVRSNRKVVRRSQTEGEDDEEGEEEGEEQQGKNSDIDREPPYPPPEQEIQYGKVLNRLLPPDIRILAWCPSPPEGFSARFSCRERQYRYFFTQPAYFGAPAPHGDAHGGAASDGWLDIDAMRAAAHHFVGVHDFRNFCKVDPNKQITNFVRRIFDADIVEVPDVHSSLNYYGRGEDGCGRGPKVYSFDVRGSAFLWHQIRHMVAVLFLVGEGREPASVVPALLDVAANPCRPGYAMAEEVPLVLWDCIFPPLGQPGQDDTVDAPNAGNWSDSLGWRTVGEEEPRSRMFADGLWRGWRAAKMDEILANRLLDVATVGGRAVVKAPAPPDSSKSHVFEGGDGPRMSGVYVPLLKRPRLASPEEVNDKFAQQKGFANAAAMREVGNWRAAIKAMKEEERARGSIPNEDVAGENGEQ